MATNDDDAMPAGVSGPGSESVTARLADTFDEFDAKVADAERAGHAMNYALDAGEAFAAIVVDADGSDEDKAYRQAKAYLNQLCDGKSALGRKDVRSHWKEQIAAKEQAATVEDGVPDGFEDLFCECLEAVTKTVLTDAKKDETEYELEFSDGRETSMVIGHSALMSHESAWKAYTSASGQYPVRADTCVDGSQYSDSDWQNRIGPVIEDLETVEKEIGPRTDAYRSVENLIERSVAYETMGDAVAEGALWVGEVAYTVETDDGTESRTVEELRVMREDIAQITSQHDVSDRGLQIELKARGLSSPRVSGISDSTYVNGSYQTFWCLAAGEMPDAADVREEVQDSMDRMPDRDDDVDDDRDDDGDGAGATDEDDGGDGGEDGEDTGDDDTEPAAAPGKIGVSGGEPGGDGQ